MVSSSPSPAVHAAPASPAAGIKRAVRATLPLAVRKRLAVWVGRQQWLGPRDWWSTELVRDLAEQDENAFHRFLWANHLGYARTYEVAERFGAERIHPTRRLLFDDLRHVLAARRIAADAVGSVLEVGCSMGYLLRHLEEHLFPAAAALDGIDIDAYAIGRGAEYLATVGSRVRLQTGDMADLPRLVGGRRYDVVFCAGTLMYLREDDAAGVVRAMLARTTGVLALAGLAHPRVDNRFLPASVHRATDRSFVHNLDALVERAGGRVVSRRWEGERQVDGNTVYFVFAAPEGP